MAGNSAAKLLHGALFLLLLCLFATTRAIDPKDPDSVAPSTISVCGSDATATLFTSSQKIRTLLATSWGLGLSGSNFTSSHTGIGLFSDGTCDVLVTASPLSEGQAAPLTRGLNRTIVEVPVAVHARRFVHSWQPWSADGQELHLTPDVLADIYQCNITRLDDPRIQASNPDLRLAHVPIIPISDCGGADTSQLMRTFAALAPNWRLGIDPVTGLPPCVAPLNVTYLDFQRNDSFYIGFDDPRYELGNPASAILDLVNDNANGSDPVLDPHQRLPASTTVDAWAAFTLVPERTAAQPVQELRSLDFLIFLVFDHDSVSRGYPVGCQIRQLGEALLSDNIQSQLPAFGMKPMSSLDLPPATVEGYKEAVASVLCKSTPEMPNSILRAEGIPEQLALAGSDSFTAMLTAALEGYSRSAVGWQPVESSIYNEFNRYPKRTTDLMILDDAIAADVLQAKERVGEGLVQVPFAMDAVVIAHTIPGIAHDSLCLDAGSISDILQCRIIPWNHPNITALNPGVRLPNQAINVTVDPLNFALVHTVAKLLGELAPGWRLGRGPTVQWPPCVRLFAASENRSRIFESDYVLGFQQNTDVVENSLGRSIRVKNRAGACVSPHNISAASLHALNISGVAPEQWENFTTASSGASDMYPLGMMGFLVWDHNSTDIGYEEGRRLKNVTRRLLSDAVQNSLPQFGVVPTYQNASAQIQQTLVQTRPDVERTPSEGVPVSDQVTCASTSVAYNSLTALYWQLTEGRQGRPFYLDTLWPSENDALNAFLYNGVKHDSALLWAPVPTQEILTASRRVMHLPIGFAPVPIVHNFEGISNIELRLDAHALAGLYSCKIRSFAGYLQTLNPNLTLPSGNITVVAMPRSTNSAKHLISYLRQDAMWDADLDGAPGWPPCVLQTSIRPHASHVSQLMLQRPNSVIGHQTIGQFLAMQILTEQARVLNETRGDLHTPINPTADVWNKMLLGMWKDSALPVARGIRVRNALGDYVAATPVQDIHFPFDNQTLQTLPDTFQSPAWGALQNPTSDMAPNAYPIGQLMFLVFDEDIGAKGRVHAKRIKSFLRYLVTQNDGPEVLLLSDNSTLDARHQSAVHDYPSVVPLSEPLKAWALEGIKQLPYDPLPPLPSAGKSAVSVIGKLTDLKGAADVYIHIAIGVALGVALMLGLIAVGLLIWRGQRQIRGNSFGGACSAKMRGSGAAATDSADLKLELDSKGEPVVLGQGSFAKVYKGRWSGVLVAVKVLNAPAAEVIDEFQRECTVLERLRHPNIIKYFGTASNAEGTVMMVTEYMPGGDLGTALAHDNPSARRLGWYQIGHLIALDIARGLAYLHAQKVISFDVKPANVLLDRTGKQAKLADVGLAKVLEHSHTMTNMRGTLDYMPPEMFGAYDEEDAECGGGQTRKQAVTQAVDVYSFGLVLWQIVTGRCLDKMLGSLRPPRVPEDCPAQIAQLYTACLSDLPERRPKAAELVRAILGTLKGSATTSSTLGSTAGTGGVPGLAGRLLPDFRRH